ncbi:MAG: hypothetical protein QXX64_03150 [Nitrososphaera sp.]
MQELGGTGVLVAIWAITRLPNPITGQAFPVNGIGIAAQALQLAFIGILVLTIFVERKKAERTSSTKVS